MKYILFLLTFFLVSCASKDLGRDHGLGEKISEQEFSHDCDGCVRKEVRYKKGRILLREDDSIERILRNND